MYNLILESQRLKRIIVDASPYKTGFILFIFDSSASVGSFFDSLKSIEQNVPLFIAANQLICIDIANFALVIKKLEDLNFIFENDKPIVFELVHKVESLLKQRESLNYKMSDIQKELFLSVAEIYIDDIVENTSNYVTTVTLLRSAFSSSDDNYEEELKTLLLKNINVPKTCDSVISSVKGLAQICQGKANLESTFLRMDSQLPKLSLQRVHIYENCVEKLKTKFSNLTDTDQLYMFLGLRLFVSVEQTLSPLVDTNEIISNALTEGTPSTTTQEAFRFKDLKTENVLPEVTTAFQVMGILRPNAWPDIERIKRLDMFPKSPALALYLRILEQKQTKVNADETNILLQGLKQNKKELVKQSLEEGADINQYFSDGLTPLITAIQLCDKEMVKLIMEYPVNVNQMNQIGAVSPLGTAIGKDLAIVQILLDAGAAIFQGCGVIRAQSLIFTNKPQLMQVPALHLAVDFYKTSKSENHKKMISLLLEYGAGIGFPFNQFFDSTLFTLLDNKVVIGAMCPKIQGINPIQTYEEFEKRIEIKDYLHWQKIFNQVLIFPSFMGNSSLRRPIIYALTLINKTLSSQGHKSAVVYTPLKFSPEMAHINMMARIRTIDNEDLTLNPFLQAMNAKDYSTAIRLACNIPDGRSDALVRIILSRKQSISIDINEQDKHGKTALHYAALLGKELEYNLLIQSGANPNLEDETGMRPRDYVKEKSEEKSENIVSSLTP